MPMYEGCQDLHLQCNKKPPVRPEPKQHVYPPRRPCCSVQIPGSWVFLRRWLGNASPQLYLHTLRGAAASSAGAPYVRVRLWRGPA